MNNYDVIVVGGGASGFFTAINIACKKPNLKILILERGKDVLQKVKVSGGGRCNVTHAEFIPLALSKNYPRGEKELRGPFHKYMTGDVMEWFEERGVSLKIEEDGRVFPVTDSSQTIINCFLAEAKKYNVEIVTSELVTSFAQSDDGWKLQTKKGNTFLTKILVVATGSQTKTWEQMKELGMQIIEPVPSLFTFNCKDERIQGLAGIAVKSQVAVREAKLKNEGPVLITHWGFSGPAILKLSAWGARELFGLNYQFQLQINWTNMDNFESGKAFLIDYKDENSRQFVLKNPLYGLPKRLWEKLAQSALITEKQKWADVSKKQIIALSNQLTQCTFNINGKSTFKDEFVTAGGVNLKEIDFKTFKSQKLPNCYMVGEVLNVDAITGGFNFQNAWTSGYLAAQDIVIR